GVAAPGIADVVEEVRADDVPAQAPGWLPAPLAHPLGAQRDLVDPAHLERAVVEARPLGTGQRQVVVVGAAAQEGDVAGYLVGELHAERVHVEALLALDVRREQQDVAQAPRAGLAGYGRLDRAAADPQGVARAVVAQRRILRRDDGLLLADVHQ